MGDERLVLQARAGPLGIRPWLEHITSRPLVSPTAVPMVKLGSTITLPARSDRGWTGRRRAVEGVSERGQRNALLLNHFALGLLSSKVKKGSASFQAF